MVVYNNVLAGAAGSGGADAYEIKRSLRFNRSDSAHLTKNFGTAGNRKKWTYSTWVKRSNLGSEQMFGIERQQGNGNGYEYMRFDSNDRIDLYLTHDGSNWSGRLQTEARFRDVSAWLHVVLVCDIENSTAGDRIRLYVNGKRVTVFNASSYPATSEQTTINSTGNHHIGKISANSTYFGGYLGEIHFLDGLVPSTSTDDANGSVTGTPNAEYLTTFGRFNASGVWDPIEYDGTHGNNGFYLDFSDNSSDSALGNDAAGSNNWTVNNINASSIGQSAVVGAWASGWSGTQMGGYQPRNMFDGSTGSLTAFGSGGGTWSKSTGNGIPATSSVELFYILRSGSGSVSVNGNSLGLSEGWTNISSLFSFPTEITAMTMAQNAGNGPDIRAMKVDGKFVVDNWFSSSYPYETPDSVIDSPTNYEADSGNNGGNYPTWNPLDNGGSLALSNGNLDAADTNNNQHRACRATQRIPNSGKWYFELTITNLDNTIAFGIDTSGAADPDLGGSGRRYLLVNSGGNVQRYDGSAWTEFSGQSGLGSGASVGSVLQVAVDQDAGKLWFGVNNVWLGTTTSAAGNPSNGTNPTLTGTYTDAFPVVNCVNTKGSVNFGQRAFKYTLPTGFKSLCTQNLDNPVIKKGSKYFDTLLWTGDGASSTREITGLSMASAPDWIWAKERNGGSSHATFDAVRGFGSNNVLKTNSSDAEAGSNGGYIDSTSTSSITWAQGSSAAEFYDANNKTYVAWCWDAGDSNSSISVGGLNSAVYDQSQNWSSLLSASGGSGFSNQGNGAFAGTDSNADYTYVAGSSGSTNYTITFTPPSAISYTSSVVVRVEANHGQASIDGGTTWVSGGSSGVVTFSGSGSFSSIIVRDARGQYSGEFHSIRIDGKLLVNSGVTPPNVPSMASTNRANPSAGFSIVTYTGTGANATVGHGLNTAPSWVIIKRRNDAASWTIYSSALGATKYLRLNSTNAAGTVSSYFNDTEPTSSVFTVGTSDGVNGSGYTYVAYCFAPVEGYSAFGSYTGNASSDGTFVYTGFRPRWVLHKRSDTGGTNVGDWRIWDTERDVDNAAEDLAIPNNTTGGTTSSAHGLDILSNGFKFRTSDSNINASGGTYVYAAFAENPFKISRAR